MNAKRSNRGLAVSKSFLLVAALAGIYVYARLKDRQGRQSAEDRAADAQWANEGGGNAPTTV